MSPDAVARPKGALARYLASTDANVLRLAKLLGTTSQLDTFLLTFTYTLHLVHAGLARAGTARLERAARELAASLSAKAQDALLPGETVIATIETPPSSRLLRTEQSIKALTGLVDDFRMFMRLRGLVNMWAWGSGALRHPSADSVLRNITYAQVTACTLFQAFENWAYLCMKGVIATEPKRIGRAFVWSARFWMCHVFLDFVRLARVRQLRVLKARETGDEEKAKVTAKEVETWWRELSINLAWAPLTVHWSLEQGFAGEAMIAILGGYTGWRNLLHQWRHT